jgi:YbbR domain-containing protein
VVAAIRRNLALKLLSLLLAIVGWAYFRFASNPFITARFDQQFSVPVTAVNLASGYIAKIPDRVAVVTIEPKRGDPPVKADQIKAVLDLSNRGAGVYNVPVQLVAPSVVVQSLSPASITLEIQKIDQRSLPVGVQYNGKPNVVVSRSAVTPQNVTVRGPSEEVAQVANVRIDLSLDTTQTSVDKMIRPVAVNSQGQELTGVEVIPNLVRVQANFLPATHS